MASILEWSLVLNLVLALCVYSLRPSTSRHIPDALEVYGHDINNTSAARESIVHDGHTSRNEPGDADSQSRQGEDDPQSASTHDVMKHLATIKSIVDTLPTRQSEAINGFLGTLDSYRFEDDALPSTSEAYTSRPSTELSEAEESLIKSWQDYKAYRVEEADDDAETGIGTDRISEGFARADAIKPRSRMMSRLVLEDALDAVRERDRRIAFKKFESNRRSSFASVKSAAGLANLGVIEEVGTPAVEVEEVRLWGIQGQGMGMLYDDGGVSRPKAVVP